MNASADPVTEEDPRVAAQRVIDNPAKKGSAEWLAAEQLLLDGAPGPAAFNDLESEVQKLRGMSEI